MAAYAVIRFGDACEVEVLRVVQPDGAVIRTHISRPLPGLAENSESSEHPGFEEGYTTSDRDDDSHRLSTAIPDQLNTEIQATNESGKRVEEAAAWGDLEQDNLKEEEGFKRFEWAEDKNGLNLSEPISNIEEALRDETREFFTSRSKPAGEDFTDLATGEGEIIEGRTPPEHADTSSLPPAPSKEPAPLILQNILVMSLEQRKSLLSDPRAVTVIAADEEMIKIPLGIFQTMSNKASQINFSNNQAPVYPISYALKNGPFVYIREWLKTYFTVAEKMPLMLTDDRVKTNNACNQPSILKQELSIITASKLMGMELYTRHIFKRRWKLLSLKDPTSPHDMSKILSLDDIDVIDSVAFADKDPFFVKVVQRLGWSIHKEALPDNFIAFLDDPAHSRLHAAVDIELKRLKDLEDERRANRKAMKAKRGAENRAKYKNIIADKAHR